MKDIIKNTCAYTQASFTLKNRILRTFWVAVYIVLFRLSPRPLHWWRAFILRCFGAKLGKHCHIYPSAKIWAPWNLICSDYVGVGDYAYLYNQAPIYIGKKVVISQGVQIYTGTHDYNDPDFKVITKPVTIKDHAWICAEACILQGVTIGEGAIVGARSVVTKNVQSWKIYAGNPIKEVKDRPRLT
jgi:putative colanic acid biosynthesis acetyltransferase WcaF